MVDFGILDAAIALMLVYLLLSFVSSAVAEWIEGKLKLRAADLRKGIGELLNESGGAILVEELYQHPLVWSLYRGSYDPAKTSNLPSYIPSRNFALALMDIVAPATAEAKSGTTG